MTSLHSKKLPNETEMYRQARNKLLQEEINLRTQAEEVAKKRRSLPEGGLLKEDYIFDLLVDGEVHQIKLSELFKDKNSLIIYSFMYGPEANSPCSMCTSIVSALNGNAHDISQRASIVVVAKSAIERMEVFADERKWQSVKLLSSLNNNYNQDYYGEDESGNQWPICNVFVKKGEGIYHSYATEMLHVETEEGMDARHVDFMWPLYNYLDITPEGRGDWYPGLEY